MKTVSFYMFRINVRRYDKKDQTFNEKKYYADADGLQQISAEDIVLAPTGHDWGEWEVVTEPTATEPGLKQRVCRNDPDHIDRAEILPKPLPDISDSSTLNGYTVTVIGCIFASLYCLLRLRKILI